MEKKSVYIMQCGENCKIGVSKNAKERLRTISIGNPNIKIIWESGKIYNAYEIEATIHKKYSSVSVGRDWFKIKDTEKLIYDIDQLIEKMQKREIISKSNRKKQKR